MGKASLFRKIAACLLFAVIAAGVVSPAGALAAPKEYTSFTVYFPFYMKLGSFVYPVRYLVPLTSSPMKAALDALIAGIPGSPFIRLPEGTTVEVVSTVDGVCTVNFSREIMNVNVGSGGEASVLSSIVATVGQFGGVDAVSILVDGQPMETLAGHVDISGPLPDDRIPVLHLFDDVFQHWSGGAVGALTMLEVLDGYPDGTYKPDNKVTRAEFIKMLVEGLRFPQAANQTVPFTDVVGQWHEEYVKRALASGLIKASDYGDTLKPDEVIPREEMAALLVTASAAYLEDHPEVEYAEVSPVPAFTDIADAAEKYRTAIADCAKLDLLRGFEDDTFRPKEGLTRGEAATVIARVLGMANSDDIVRVTPIQGSTWDGGGITTLGVASAFEANVNWRIADASDEDILMSYVTTTEGMGWGLFGLHVDGGLFAGEKPSVFELFLVSMKDGEEYSSVKMSLAD